VGNSLFISTLKKSGYKYIQLNSSWEGIKCFGLEDHCISNATYITLNKTLYALFDKTPFYPIIKKFIGKWNEKNSSKVNNNIHPSGIDDVKSWIKDHGVHEKQPYVLFA